MPILVQHGPNQSRYGSVLSQAARQNAQYDRSKDIAEYMQDVKQGNRQYELGKEGNRLTGRGQDIQQQLGMEDVRLREKGLNLQEVDKNRMYELGLREQDLRELTQKQGYELGLLKVNQERTEWLVDAGSKNPEFVGKALGLGQTLKDNSIRGGYEYFKMNDNWVKQALSTPQSYYSGY